MPTASLEKYSVTQSPTRQALHAIGGYVLNGKEDDDDDYCDDRGNEDNNDDDHQDEDDDKDQNTDKDKR